MNKNPKEVRVSIDVRMLGASGIGTYLQNLIPMLAPNFTLILLGQKSLIKEKLKIDYDKHEIIEADIPIYSLKEIFYLPFLIPQADIFWSPHYNVPLVALKVKRRLVTIHDVYHLAFYNNLSIKQKLYAKLFFNLAIKLSDKIITNSFFSKSQIQKYLNIDQARITPIHLGINHQLFQQIQDTDILQAVREKYELPEKFLLFVGNVKPHKNLWRLLSAFAEVLNHENDIHLVITGKKEGFIIGDHSIFNLIEQNKQLKKRVKFTGYVPVADLPVIYNLAYIFVFPSLYEGFGFPPLEAMACGCPVIVSDKASMPEICGDAAMFTDPYDINDIKDKILMVLNSLSLRQSLKNKGLLQQKKYEWEKTMIMHQKVINELTN